jgi:hypothetical protein
MSAYAIGYNGHAKSCTCDACYKARAEARYERATNPMKLELDPDKPIFVTSHWRRGKVRPETLKAHRAMMKRHRSHA